MDLSSRDVSKAWHLLCIMVLVSTFVALLSCTAYAVTNGQPDGDEHPYVGLVVFDVYDPDLGINVPAWRCSGSLISPTVVLCAGHCTDGAVAARVWFDEVVEGNPDYPWGGPSAVEVAEIHTCPGFCIGCGRGNGLPGWITHDVGILILEEEVIMGEYGELPTEGLVDTLPMMADVDQVGYGVQWQEHGGGPPYWVGPKVRLFAPAQLIASNHVLSDEFMRTTANPGQGKGGTAFGDSGGPVLMGGTNIVLGVTSWGTNYNCAGVSYVQRVDTADVLNWIDSEFGDLLG